MSKTHVPVHIAHHVESLQVILSKVGLTILPSVLAIIFGFAAARFVMERRIDNMQIQINALRNQLDADRERATSRDETKAYIDGMARTQQLILEDLRIIRDGKR